MACDELPATTTTVSPGWASRMPVAAAISSSGIRPWRRSNCQRSSRPRSCSLARGVQLPRDIVEVGFHFGYGTCRQHVDAGQVGNVHQLDAAGPAVSSLTAASSARMAGGEPSYPTTGYRFPADGAVAFIAAKAIRFPSCGVPVSGKAEAGDEHAGLHVALEAGEQPAVGGDRRGTRCDRENHVPSMKICARHEHGRPSIRAANNWRSDFLSKQ
jgi:hypothetical protein